MRDATNKERESIDNYIKSISHKIDDEIDLPIKHENKPYLMIPILDGATNGDMLCYMFPNMHYTLSDKSPRVVTTIGIAASFDINWWNAPYKRGDN